jgi:NADPH-dependent 2,4-dienoyl-CoA reductase/sulfur reductase-like enzyme
MNPIRRQLLLGTAAVLCAPHVIATPARPRVVVIGGGWGGLAAARALAAACDVVLVERQPRFVVLPLSNRWLAGRAGKRRLQHDYAPAAAAFGYRVLAAEVLAIDRATRRVDTSAGPLAYDWLVVAGGISEDAAALFDGDATASRHYTEHFASAYRAGADLDSLKRRLDDFAGGEFLLTLPLAPYRCPPAPYERAVVIAHAIRSRRLKAHLTVVDPNPPWPAYQRIFAERYRQEVSYLPNTRLRQLDPYRQVATLDIDEVKFAAAIVMPPQGAATLCRTAGLTAPDSAWAATDARHFGSLADERVFVVGDSVGMVSPLFGHYPKTGQLASRMGQIAATEILARIAGNRSEAALPDSTCYAWVDLEPAERVRIDTSYRRRGDGELVQTIRQQREHQPGAEDDAWLDSHLLALLGPAAAG